MKFLLIMQVCSSIHLSCMNEMPGGEYVTHFDCATAGYLNAIGMMRDIGVEQTNEQKIVISFKCKETPIAGVHHHRYSQ